MPSGYQLQLISSTSMVVSSRSNDRLIDAVPAIHRTVHTCTALSLMCTSNITHDAAPQHCCTRRPYRFNIIRGVLWR